MSAFTGFEREVVKTLVSPHMPTEQVTAVLNSASIVSCEYTGVGYFLTVRHPALPSERVVCNEPLVTGRCDDVVCGFVVFLKNGELTLECHSWGDAAVAEDFREQRVEIEFAA